MHAKLFVQCSAALFNWVPRPCPATGWVVRLRVGRAGKATAPPPPSLSLVSSPRTNAPSPFLLLSPPSLPLPLSSPAEIPAPASPEDYPIHSAVCRRGECCAGLCSLRFTSLLSSTSSSTRARLLELRFRCFGFAFA